jgi:hypothetical protein
MTKRLFNLGRIVATPAALELIESTQTNAAFLLEQHQSGQWGDLDQEDQQTNRQSLLTGARIMSSYKVGEESLWVITDAVEDATRPRLVTTLLLPSDY